MACWAKLHYMKVLWEKWDYSNTGAHGVMPHPLPQVGGVDMNIYTVHEWLMLPALFGG